MVFVQRYQVPSQQSLAFFSGEPVLFFTSVVAGTNKRRWHSVGGKGKAAQECSGPDVLDSVSGSSGMNELVAVLSGSDPVCGPDWRDWTVRSSRSCALALLVRMILAIRCPRCRCLVLLARMF